MPLRIEIIERLQRGRPLSATLLTAQMDYSLSHLSYHLKSLHQARITKIAKTAQKRGATETFYSLEGSNAQMALEMLAADGNGR